MVKVKNGVLGVGIFVLYLLVVFQGIIVFYPSPEYSDFCDRGDFVEPRQLLPDTSCKNVGIAQKQDECAAQKSMFRAEYDDQGCVIDGYCDDCDVRYQEQREAYDQNFFVIVLVVGILTLLIGYGFCNVEPVGSALLAGGIGAIFIGVVSRWDALSDVWRFILLVLALVLLVWLAVQANREGKWWKVFVKR